MMSRRSCSNGYAGLQKPHIVPVPTDGMLKVHACIYTCQHALHMNPSLTCRYDSARSAWHIIICMIPVHVQIVFCGALIPMVRE